MDLAPDEKTIAKMEQMLSGVSEDGKVDPGLVRKQNQRALSGLAALGIRPGAKG